MTDTFFYAPCITNDPPCGVKNTEGACQPTPMPTTAAPTISAAPTLSPTLSSVPTSKPSAVPTADPTGAPTVAPTMDWTTFCETKNTTSACTAEVGCHWLDPYSRCIPECAFGIDNRDACDTRYCSWRWTPKLPITGKCLECDAARKYETCDCGDASWGSAASRQTRSGRRNLKFGYVELNTGFVVEGSVELDGVTLADAEAHAADITSTIIDVAGGVRPADVTTCASATTTTPTCTVENQLCTTGAGTTAEKKYCCIMDEAGSGAWTAGACAPDFDDITVILSPAARRRRRGPRRVPDPGARGLRRHRGRLGRRAVHGAGQVPRRRDHLQGLVLLYRTAVLPPGPARLEVVRLLLHRRAVDQGRLRPAAHGLAQHARRPRRRQERPRLLRGRGPEHRRRRQVRRGEQRRALLRRRRLLRGHVPELSYRLRRHVLVRLRRRLREHPRHGGPQRDRGRRRGRDHEEGLLQRLLRQVLDVPRRIEENVYPPPLPPSPPPRPSRYSPPPRVLSDYAP